MTQIISNDTHSVYNHVVHMASEEYQTFGQWLTAQIERSGMSQTEIAAKSRVSKNYISTLAGDRLNTRGELVQPRMDKVERIAKALGVSLVEAKIAAGYHAASRAPRNLQGMRLLEYFEQLPTPTQDDAVTIVEALWRRHGRQETTNNEAAAPDPQPDSMPPFPSQPPLVSDVHMSNPKGEPTTGRLSREAKSDILRAKEATREKRRRERKQEGS